MISCIFVNIFLINIRERIGLLAYEINTIFDDTILNKNLVRPYRARQSKCVGPIITITNAGKTIF